MYISVDLRTKVSPPLIYTGDVKEKKTNLTAD